MWIVIFCMLSNGGTIPWYITMVNYEHDRQGAILELH